MPRGWKRSVLISPLLIVASVAVFSASAVTSDAANAKKPSTTKTTVKQPTKEKKPAVRKVTSASVRAARARRDAVRKQRATLASQVKAATATTREAERALKALTGDVRAAQRELTSAERSLAAAESELSDAMAAEKAIEQRIGQLHSEQRTLSVGAYASGAAEDSLLAFASPSLADTGRLATLAELASQRSADLLDELRALQEDLERERTAAQRARERRESVKNRIAARLDNVSAARKRQEVAADEADARLEEALAEAESLAQVDSAAAAAYQQEADALARQIEAADRSGRRASSGAALPAVGSVRAVSSSGTRGIRVAASIQGDLSRMLDAAERDGIILRGGGYRSSSQQIALRRAHCGGSSFAIYQMRSSQCRPPTARPGASQHERGLAIDFTQNGRSLNRGSSGYRWLKANAYKYGFKNLPSEPWHWSRNGR